MGRLRGKYTTQKAHARQRGIPFWLTFDEWLTIWQDSGCADERGRGRDKYCMARIGDRGAYEVGNVKIIRNSENVLEKKITDETRAIWSRQRKGNKYRLGIKHTDEARERISESLRGQKRPTVSAANVRRVWSAKSVEKCREARRRWWADKKSKRD